jgi:DHA2 family multidrug resistance protein
LKTYRDRSFAVGNLVIFTELFCLFGSIFLLPLYLQKLMNYTAFWAGLVVGPSGLASFFIMPIAGILMKHGVKPRYLLMFGLSTMSYSVWLMSGFSLEAGFAAISWPRLVQGLGLGLFFVPLATGTFANISKEEMGNASGIFNLIRNLGGSFGVAFSVTTLARRTQVHQTFLVEHLTPFNPTLQTYYEQTLRWLQGRYSEPVDYTTPLALIYREVLRQAGMLAFNDCFWLLAWMTAFLLPFTLLFKKGRAGTPVGMAH